MSIIKRMRILRVLNGFGLGIFFASIMQYVVIAITGKIYLIVWPIAMSVAGGAISFVSWIWLMKLYRAAVKNKESSVGYSGVNEKSDHQDR